MFRSRSVVTVLLLASTGCAHIGLGAPTVIGERTVSTKVVARRVNGPASASVAQEGKSVTVNATRACFQDDVEIHTVEVTTEREKHNESKTFDWAMLAVGGLLVGGGAFAIADPSAVASSSGSGSGTGSSGSTAGSTSTGSVTASGVALVSLGVALAVIPLVDAIRSSGSVREVSRREAQGNALHHVACGQGPYAGARVEGTAGATKVTLGTADGGGSLRVDLAERIPIGVALAPNGPKLLDLTIDGKAVGQADLQPLRDSYEEAAWREANGEWPNPGPIACTKAIETSATEHPEGSTQMLYEMPMCAPIERFVQQFPNGRHGTEAAALAATLHAKLDATQRATAAAWQRARLDSAARAAAAAANEEAKARAAAHQAQEHQACEAQCRGACAADRSCATACIRQKCP